GCHGAGADHMPTTLNSAVESYLRAKALSRGTRNEYFSTLRKWEQWGGGVPIEQLRRKEVREFLDWAHQRAVPDEGLALARPPHFDFVPLQALGPASLVEADCVRHVVNSFPRRSDPLPSSFHGRTRQNKPSSFGFGPEQADQGTDEWYEAD